MSDSAVDALDALIDAMDRLLDFVEPASDVKQAAERLPEWDAIQKSIARARGALAEVAKRAPVSDEMDDVLDAAWKQHGRFHTRADFAEGVRMVLAHRAGSVLGESE